MSETFSHDVFLSHSAKDKEVVRALAERLRKDRLKVWFDEWEIKPGDSIPAKLEEGLEHSRVLVLCMSAKAFGAEWSQLEAGTFRFRDPQNKNRRFIPLRLDEISPEGAVAQYSTINWLTDEQRRGEYSRLLDACRKLKEELPEQQAARERLEVKIRSLGHTKGVRSVVFSPDGRRALSGADDNAVRIWEVETGRCVRVLEGHVASVLSVAWNADGERVLSGADDNSVRLWEVETGHCICVLEGHTGTVRSVAWGADGKRILSTADDKTVRLWEVETGRCLRVLHGHTDSVRSVAWGADDKHALSGADDDTLRLWEVETGRCVRVLEGHTASVYSVAWCADGKRALSGAYDNTVRLWEIVTGRCLRVFKGHSSSVHSVAWSADGKRALSGSYDKTVRLWEVNTGRCLRIFKGHGASIYSVAWRVDGKYALSGADDNTVRLWRVDRGRCLRVFEGHSDSILCMQWSADGKRILSGADDSTVRLWELDTGRCLREFKGHTARVHGVAWSADGRRAVSGADDNTVRLWEVKTGRCLCVLEGHTDSVYCVAWCSDGSRIISGGYDRTLRLWEVGTGRCLRVLKGHSSSVYSIACSADGKRALSGSGDNSVRLWELDTGRCLSVLKGHTASVNSVGWSPDGKRALSGAGDNTVRIWEMDTSRCLRVLEGHTANVMSVAWSPNCERVASGSADNSLRVWDVESGRCLRVFKGHTDWIRSVSWSADGRHAFSGAKNGVWREWDVAKFVTRTRLSRSDVASLSLAPDQVLYTNAKVLLVGDSGTGKTALSNYLAHGIKVEDDKLLPSTDGAWATHWLLKQDKKKNGVEREIWLWDFAGQVDYRLVHQLFMDDTAVAVMVFDPQKEDLFEGLGRWDRDLQKAARNPFAKLLTAARVDRGGLAVSAVSMKRFMKDRRFDDVLHETSAKSGKGCGALREAIVKAIDWKGIPETTSPALYHRMKQEILSLRDSGMVLIRLAELKQRMEMTLKGEGFELAELEAVVRLLAGPGMIQRLDFGEFILLRPEVLSRYAAAVVRKIRKHPQELGCIREDEILTGDLDYQDFKRLENKVDERVVLRALLENFIGRAWCLRLPCEETAMLTFPNYFRRERKEQPDHPSVLVTYRFDGPVDEIYATLVVRLHHTKAFESMELWKSAADFKTQTGEKLGFTLEKESEGRSRLEVYFEQKVDAVSQVLFLRYVHDHLTAHAKNVERLRHYCCGNRKCRDFEKPFRDQEAIDEALAEGGEGKVFCGKCGKPIPLRDVIEKKFESPQVKAEAVKMQEESQAVIDSESKDLILTGHAISITGEAGQIYRGYTGGDHGIDGEIEFKDEKGRASGKRLYVQLKSGDSYLTTRRRDGVEVFQIKKARWATYWQKQHYLVMLVIRTSDGVIRWMEVSEYLKRESAGGKTVKQIEFKGERFDALSVQNWRKRVLGGR